MPAWVWPAEVMVASFEVVAANIFGQPEIEHLDPAFVRDHDIGGLQVAMHDAFLVSGGERIGQRAGDFDDLLRLGAACGNQAIERLAFDQLHGDEVDVVGFLDRIDGHDVGVIERGDGASLALEAGEAVGIASHRGGQNFERDIAAELGVGGAIHFSHAARAERCLDFIKTELCAGNKCHEQQRLYPPAHLHRDS